MTFRRKENLTDILIWILIILVPVIAMISLAVLFRLTQLSAENRDFFHRQTQQIVDSQQKTQNYVQCLALLFVASQDKKITSADLDTCTFQVGQPSVNNVTLPQGSSAPQSVQPAPVPNPPQSPKQCSVNLLGLCL